jgi:hypothetical protein
MENRISRFSVKTSFLLRELCGSAVKQFSALFQLTKKPGSPKALSFGNPVVLRLTQHPWAFLPRLFKGRLYRDCRLKYGNGLKPKSGFPDLLFIVKFILMWLLDSWLLTGNYRSKNIAKLRGF